MNRYKEIKQDIKAEILQSLDFSEEIQDETILELIHERIYSYNQKQHLSMVDRDKLTRDLFHSIRRLDLLEDFLSNPQITEIMVNGLSGIFYEQQGRLLQSPETFESKEKLLDIIQQIVARCNRVVNEASPIVDARLEDGSRVHVVLSPVALNGPILTIRRFPQKPLDMEELLRKQFLTQEVAGFLESLVVAGYNILISGGTGSGKTTFLNALSQYIPADQRIITIEDSAELQILNKENLVRMETRNANIEGCIPISIRDLIRAALRMRPDRIIVGEVRGSEAVDMIQAFNTGHEGSLSTAHANSAKDMLFRLETMFLMGLEIPLTAIRSQIAMGIDIIIQIGRLRDKSRRLLEILEVLDYENDKIQTRLLYEFQEEGLDASGQIVGSLVKKEELNHRHKLIKAGMEEL